MKSIFVLKVSKDAFPPIVVLLCCRSSLAVIVCFSRGVGGGGVVTNAIHLSIEFYQGILSSHISL